MCEREAKAEMSLRVLNDDHNWGEVKTPWGRRIMVSEAMKSMEYYRSLLDQYDARTGGAPSWERDHLSTLATKAEKEAAYYAAVNDNILRDEYAKARSAASRVSEAYFADPQPQYQAAAVVNPFQTLPMEHSYMQHDHEPFRQAMRDLGVLHP